MAPLLIAAAAALSAISGIDLSEKALSKAPSVTFVSDESSALTGHPILNRVHFFEVGAADVWLMRQRQDRVEGEDPAHWSYVGIVVARSKDRRSAQTAYFFEFAPAPVASGKLPEVIAARVDCFRCHPNGPRAVRPASGRDGTTLSAEDRALIATWNDRIANAGVVQVAGTSIDEDSLPLPKCRQCHAATSGIRGPLLRVHAASIMHLIQENGHERPFMPLEDEPLDATERRCLEVWLSGEKLGAECAVDSVDAHGSEVTADVKTSIGSFHVRNLALKGFARCKGGLCRATMELKLDAATTGSSLRDRHMRNLVFQADRFGAVSGTVRPFAEPKGDTPTSLRLIVDLSVRGVVAPVTVDLTCVAHAAFAHCTVTHFVWNLTDHGIDPPSFLGLKVDPLVSLRGRLRLEFTSKTR